MGVKIHNGIRYVVSDFWELHERLMALRPQINAIQYDQTVLFVARRVANVIDVRALGLPEKEEHGSRPALLCAIDELWTRQDKIKKTGLRDPAVDQEFEVTVLPFRGQFYGTVLTEQQEIRELFYAQEWVEEYWYWDNADRHEDITEEEWDVRREIWSGIMAQDRFTRIGGCGFAFEVLPDFAYPKTEDVVSRIPAFDDRVKAQALNRVAVAFRERQKEIEGSGVVAGYLKALRYANSPEGAGELQQAINEIAEILPKVIDQELLLQSPDQGAAADMSGAR